MSGKFLSDQQREAVLSGRASWFEPSALVAAQAHAEGCPECLLGPARALSTLGMCRVGRLVALGESPQGGP